MTPTQRAAAERLADTLDRNQYDAVTASAMGEAAALLRELLAEPVQKRAAVERLAFEQWYDAQPEGRINPWDVWQAAATRRELLAEPQGKPVAWPARHVSLKQRRDKTMRLILDLDAVEGWPNYWLMRSDARGLCSTPTGCLTHGCHGECLYAAPQQRKPLTEDFINDLGFQCGLQREDARNPGVEEFARAIERHHGITGEPT